MQVGHWLLSFTSFKKKLTNSGGLLKISPLVRPHVGQHRPRTIQGSKLSLVQRHLVFVHCQSFCRLTVNMITDENRKNVCDIRGHPFMTSTRRGRGSGSGEPCGRGERGSSPMWTSTQKIKIRVHWRHTVYFSCKEVGVIFTRISSLDRKKVEIFLRYKLVI